LTPYRLAHGRAPAARSEVVLDAGLARAGALRVGDRVRIVDPAGSQTFALVGVATASRAQQDRQSSAFLTPARAQQLTGLGSGFNAIAVRARPGIDNARLRARIADAVGGRAQVLDHRHAALDPLRDRDRGRGRGRPARDTRRRPPRARGAARRGARRVVAAAAADGCRAHAQGNSWDAAGLDPPSTRGTLDLDVRAGSLDSVRGDGIAVSDTIAKHGVELGSVLEARLADATPARLRVVAIYGRSNGIGDAYLGDVKAQGQENARSQWVVVALMILIAVMAAFNTGAMAATERRRELLLAGLSGATRGQVIGAVTLESLLTTLAGIGIGVAVALVSLAGAGSDPSGGPLVIPWGQAGLVLGGAVALGLSGTLLPAALAGRARLTALTGLRE
jgi:hypothetical protein